MCCSNPPPPVARSDSGLSRMYQGALHDGSKFRQVLDASILDFPSNIASSVRYRGVQQQKPQSGFKRSV
jgi:hypothetical protein